MCDFTNCTFIVFNYIKINTIPRESFVLNASFSLEIFYLLEKYQICVLELVQLLP